jgi:uncharacterized lipoprotein YmbA
MVKLCLPILAALAVTSCSSQRTDGSTYTLYRSGGTVPGIEQGRAEMERMRIHVATFDAREGEAYNQENCRIAGDLFQGQPGVTSRFWCEKGRYRP